MHGNADPTVSRRLAEDVQWQLDPLHFLVTLDRLTGLGHGIDKRELYAFGVALRPIAVGRPQKLGVYKRAWGSIQLVPFVAPSRLSSFLGGRRSG
jgi:hypothetical protein